MGIRLSAHGRETEGTWETDWETDRETEETDRETEETCPKDMGDWWGDICLQPMSFRRVPVGDRGDRGDRQPSGLNLIASKRQTVKSDLTVDRHNYHRQLSVDD